MLSKCANPACDAPFLYMHQGKLFRLEVSTEATATVQAAKKAARHVEFFWLCDRCAAEMRLTYRDGVGVTTIPLAKVHGIRASAS
jgi:hypothetical protein